MKPTKAADEAERHSKGETNSIAAFQEIEDENDLLQKDR